MWTLLANILLFHLLACARIATALPSAASANLTPTRTNDTSNANTITASASCYPVVTPPSDFHCRLAFAEFANTLNDQTLYAVAKIWTPPFRNMITAPKKKRVGSCEFMITCSRPIPPIPVYGDEIKALGNQLLRTCVADESHSSGGKIWSRFRTAPVPIRPDNWLGIKFRDVRNVSEDEEDGEDNGAWDDDDDHSSFPQQ